MMKFSKHCASLRHYGFSVAMLSGVLLAGCATSSLTRQDVARRYDAVAQLSNGLEDARARDGALLAPDTFKQVEKQLGKAIGHARDADKQSTNDAAQKGLEKLGKLNKTIEANGQEMEEVVDIRTRANMQGADALFEERSKEADEDFRSASRLLEEGKIDEARGKRPELIDQYAKLELDALKKGAVAAAKEAISDAEEADADDYSPKTLENARAELKLATSVLDADRTQVEKSNSYARNATWMAHRAHQNTDLIKDFEAHDLSHEDQVLWYQAQLQRVRNALRDETLPFDQSNTKVIQALRNDALALKSVMKESRLTNQIMQQRVSQLEQSIEAQRRAHEGELRDLLANNEERLSAMNSGNATQLDRAQESASEEIAMLKERLSTQALEQANEQRRERRSQERFEATQNLFHDGEAQVFRQGNNVLIRLGGFSFSSGKDEVEAKNYALLNKVVTAINTFPESSVRISGHTDALGSDSHNLDLSVERAQNVVGFLSTVGGINASRLTADGKGEEDPVASNDSASGRAENRRIDLLIVNNELPGDGV